jgi:4'-phosphopantetheinyl transferase EntD
MTFRCASRSRRICYRSRRAHGTDWRMTSITDPALQSAIAALAVPGVLIGHRLISPGDEHALAPDEIRGISSSVVERRRASGAARIVARELLGRLGLGECRVPRASSGAPIWPAGVIGSLAHDRRAAVAAVGASREIGALGIDVEPAEALPDDLLDIVATPDERLKIGDDPFSGRLLFAAKEAVYKAVYPLDRTFLDHHDVQIDFSNLRGVVRNGRVVELRYCISTHLIVLAFLPALPRSPATGREWTGVDVADCGSD